MTTTRIAHDSLVDALVNRIRDDVLARRYPAGSRLPPERDLAASYGVTRTSLKHALVRLAQAGLLETRHGVGTVVLDYRRHGGPDLLPMLLTHALGEGTDGRWLVEVFEVRQEVGALVAARAAAHRGADQADALRAQLAAVTAARDADAAQLAEAEVHRMLAAAAGNRVYELLVNSLLKAYLEVRSLFRAPFADPAVAGARLAPLVDAVCAGAPDAARTAAEEYLARTRELMLGR
ncbi:FadR/GntR family transcriptional regulator [Micromonospora sp. WMMD558]|uniref:FadR/GntR family transcriptional regulator n=1 Tax=unclassified Micromonospora TaxID=2617518 RepID=UPI001E622131|nr:GntR family transcriptional regulator [Micromonospora sp. WMMC415]